MRVFLCDDELKMQREIQEKIIRLCPTAQVVTCDSGAELLKILEEKETVCDVLFLDIDMPTMTGMEVAEHLKNLMKKPLLVFVTNHDELVYESFQYHPFGFIRKQFLEQELEKVLVDCQRELDQNEKHFNFRTVEGEVCLPLLEIFYFESVGNYVKIYTGSEVYRVRSTMMAMENAVSTQGFLRLHKGFLVNQAAIRLFGTETVELLDGKILPVGKVYGENAKQQFMRYLRS